MPLRVYFQGMMVFQFCFKHKSETIFLSLERGADVVLGGWAWGSCASSHLNTHPSGPTANIDLYWAVHQRPQLLAFLKGHKCAPHRQARVLTSQLLTFAPASISAPCTPAPFQPQLHPCPGWVDRSRKQYPWERLSSSTEPESTHGLAPHS